MSYIYQLETPPQSTFLSADTIRIIAKKLSLQDVVALSLTCKFAYRSIAPLFVITVGENTLKSFGGITVRRDGRLIGMDNCKLRLVHNTGEVESFDSFDFIVLTACRLTRLREWFLKPDYHSYSGEYVFLEKIPNENFNGCQVWTNGFAKFYAKEFRKLIVKLNQHYIAGISIPFH